MKKFIKDFISRSRSRSRSPGGARTKKPTPDDITNLKQKFEAAGQGHVFTFWDQLSADDQAVLYTQLLDINPEHINFIYKQATDTAAGSSDPNAPAAKFDPLPDSRFESLLQADNEKIAEWENIGLTAIAKNEVAVILMAGGQGTRLGSSAPKGCYDINLPSKKSLFEIQAQRIRRLEELAQTKGKNKDIAIPWYIMTSGPTHRETFNFFRDNKFFGLQEKNVIFFEQGTLPCLTMDGKILLETKGKVAIAPDGNGGIYAALRNKGVLESLKQRGIKYTHCYCVDNCLVKVADPIFLGYCIKNNADCAAKTVVKEQPDEPVGVVCLRDQKFSVVEYSEISKEISEQRNEDGTLAFCAANIVNHFYTTQFLDSVEKYETQFEYHIAKKKIKHTDLETGEQIAPKTPNGMKLERFVFDVFPFTEHMSVFLVDRKEEFSPLKNAPGSGSDCPETSRRDIVAQMISFVEKAGGRVEAGEGDDINNLETLRFELSPLVSYAGEGLEEVVKDKVITTPAVIENRQQLIELAK